MKWQSRKKKSIEIDRNWSKLCQLREKFKLIQLEYEDFLPWCVTDSISSFDL